MARASNSSNKLALFLALNLVLLSGSVHGCSYCPTPTPAVPTPPIVVPPPPYIPPTPAVPVPSGGGGACPIDTLKLSACASVLSLLKLGLNVPASEQCCPLLSGLADLDAAVCLCTAIKANVLGLVSVNVKVDLTLLLNQCGKICPADFTCSL
ncbi:cortical cell-delineating protein [Brachypodium distachyon]|uniref:Proline-rich protein n=1 Tax=Brachypodium distachyon TaxID=15368 RepID=C3SAB5_BRADI|nr:cortical cell-delineating protein [Brachypodium distachyon]ACF22749.1 proline-rich protein [Brachypodium distachyon]KQK24124.1 hypothetical protein BRADI_1g78260v3 [Brachypodium distachyon]|eukprot:XP_003562227.1 cortical cell-delineating protein [Brachypodium distachyon]